MPALGGDEARPPQPAEGYGKVLKLHPSLIANEVVEGFDNLRSYGHLQIGGWCWIIRLPTLPTVLRLAPRTFIVASYRSGR